MARSRALLVPVALALAACGGDEAPPPEAAPAGSMTLTSPAFAEGDTVPVRFTCDGEDVSPPLEWSGVPAEASELTLTLSDPDAPGGTFVHWAVSGIDPASTGVAEGGVPAAGTEQPNGFGGTGYGGPCPPEGDSPHRYVFTIAAQDDSGTALAAGELSASYGRS